MSLLPPFRNAPFVAKASGRCDFPQAGKNLRLAPAALFLLAALGCFQGVDRGPANGPPAAAPPVLAPLSPTVAPGQSLPFTLTGSGLTSLLWSVNPPAGGTFAANGLFTAGQTAGSYTITATYTRLGRTYQLSTGLTVGPAALSAQLDPQVVAASGGPQQGSTRPLAQEVVAGENVGLGTASNPSGTLQNRSGFSFGEAGSVPAEKAPPSPPEPR